MRDNELIRYIGFLICCLFFGGTLYLIFNKEIELLGNYFSLEIVIATFLLALLILVGILSLVIIKK